MNKAQKRTWLTFIISLVTLVIAGALFAATRSGVLNSSDHLIYRIVGITATIPLILIVLSKYCPGKAYDERDIFISRKSVIAGIIGTFIFLALGSWVLGVGDFGETIKIKFLPWFVYVTAFVWFFISSVAAILQYYVLNRDGTLNRE